MCRTTKLVALLTMLAGACSTQPDSLTEQEPPRNIVDIGEVVVEAAPPTLPPPVATTPQTAVVETSTTVPAPTTSLYATWPDVVDAQSGGVYRISGPSCADPDVTGFGTGFLVAPGVIATAAHVLVGYSRFIVERGDGVPSEWATPFAVNVAEDVALLSVPNAIGHQFTLSVTEPRSGDSVGLIGFSRGVAPERPIRGDVGQLDLSTIVYGRAVQYSPSRMFQHDMPANQGDSGAPILDPETGEVLGVNVAGFTGEIDGFGYAVYLDALRDLLDQPFGGVIDACNLTITTTTTTTVAGTSTTDAPGTTTSVAPSTTTATAGPLTYQVLLGDTVYGIARAFNTTAAAVFAVNDPAIATILPERALIQLPAGARPLTTGDVATVRYTVKAGDTIIAIAQATRTTPAQLLALNSKLSTPNALAAGEILLIPQF